MLDFDRKGLYCHKCGRNGFGNKKSLSNHVRYCKGVKLAIAHSTAKPQTNDPLKLAKSRKREVEILSCSRHDDGMTLPGHLLKKRRIRTDKNEYTNQAIDCPSSDEDFDTDNLDIYHSDNEIYFSGHGEDELQLDEDENDEEEVNVVRGPQHHNPARIPSKEQNDPYTTHVGIPSSDVFQIDLSEILQRHRTNLSLHDEIVQLIKRNSNNDRLMFSSESLQNRAPFIKSLEKRFESEPLKPVDIDVELSGGKKATVSVFDVEAMILSLLNNEELMKDENIAEGYDLLTGRSIAEETHYGEVHTGDAWEAARQHFCGDVEHNMPIALIIFGDKSHFDLHGTLSTTPICFTLSCFNESARNQAKFWRPMAYIPNLSYGKVGLQELEDNVQDEHNCISAGIQSLVRVTQQGGIPVKVRGKAVIGKVWIHFIIGDCSGNNRWCGHYNNGGNCKRPYRDCMCMLPDMSCENPSCVYITHEVVTNARKRRRLAKSKRAGDAVMRNISKQDIENAWMQDDVPLSDIVHGIYRMMPPELLHTTTEGITKYMISTLKKMILDEKIGETIREKMERLHQTLHSLKSRNSERDLPVSAARCGLFQDTLINADERKGNLFLLLCLVHTEVIGDWFDSTIISNGISPAEFKDCLKRYLAMEEWFHDRNPKEEVQAARPVIANVIGLVKKVFPRKDGYEWNIQKMHGLTKMQTYMCLFGSGMNFFGGPGECNHKKIVKDMANNTQCCVNNFTSQIAQRYYEMSLLSIAKDTSDNKLSDRYEKIEKVVSDKDVLPRGVYNLVVNNVSDEGLPTNYSTKWKTKSLKRQQCKVPYRFVQGISQFAHKNGWRNGFTVRGYTSCKIKLEDRIETFRAANSLYNGEPWYDWCLFEKFVAGAYCSHAGMILGFFKVTTNGICDTNQLYAVVQSSVNALEMSDLEESFIKDFEVGMNPIMDYYVVPVENVTHPLFVFKNYGGRVCDYFSALPRRKWSRYFGRTIVETMANND